jgi:hypothetical protein
MKKWIVPILAVLFVVVLVCLSGPVEIFKTAVSRENRESGHRVTLAQSDRGEKKEETDPHFIQVLKRLQEQLDSWLKSLNERIEKEDVTRFEVRFLEILRNILEWVKEKVDSKIESSQEKRQEKKGRGFLRETHHHPLSFSLNG